MGPFAPAGRRAHRPVIRFHLLEVTIVSAQDLPHPAASRPTYAVAWTDPPDHVATTLSPCGGGPHHAWNEKLVFPVDDAFLRSETSAVTVHLYAIRGRLSGCLPSDTLLGTVRVVLSAVRPSASPRFVALQVRRPKTLRPHGILNLGIALIPASSLYFGFGAPPSFACRDLDERRSVRRDPAALYAATGYGAVTAYGETGRNGSVARGRSDGEREREILESKLRKWRSDLSPVLDEGESPRSLGEEGKKGETSQGSGEEVKEFARGETSRSLGEWQGEVKEGTTRSPMIEKRTAPTRRRRGIFCCFRGVDGGEVAGFSRGSNRG